MILSVIKKLIMWYLNMLKEIFELLFGIKIFKFMISFMKQVIKFMKFAFISFHLVVLIYYFMYPQHIYKQLSFHKNESNNYFSYFLETSATQQLCYQWKLYKSAMIEKEEALSLLNLKIKKEESQLEMFVQKKLKSIDGEKLQTNFADSKVEQEGMKQSNEERDNNNNNNNNSNNQNKKNQDTDDIALNLLQYQNNIKKYQSEYEEYKGRVNNFNEQKRKEMMWQSWIEMDLICNLEMKNQGTDIEIKQKSSQTETSSIILELSILNLSQYPTSLKIIPLNILLIDKFHQKIPMKKDIVIQQEQSIRKSYWEKVLKAVLQKCFNILGIEIEDDVFEIRQEIQAVNKGQRIGSSISGALIQLENINNQYIIQQARVEVIPALKGLKYLIFHHFYISFVGLFVSIIVYLYVFTGIISYCCNFRKDKKND